MKILMLGMVMLLAIGMFTLAADMAPPGRDSPLAIVASVPANVIAPAVATVETEVPAEVARGGPREWTGAARVKGPMNAVGHMPLKRWRAWNRDTRAV